MNRQEQTYPSPAKGHYDERDERPGTAMNAMKGMFCKRCRERYINTTGCAMVLCRVIPCCLNQGLSKHPEVGSTPVTKVTKLNAVFWYLLGAIKW